MNKENDLYTDYALQLFSSYMSEDISSMSAVLESFKSEDSNVDTLFMPGIIYGLMYHMATLIENVSELTGAPAELLVSSYAMDYAIKREDLLDNPLLNVKHARDTFDEILEQMKDIEQFKNLFDE